MKINQSRYTILELLAMLTRKEIIINKDYQRGQGIWPETARTYFIDSILEGFPFPKLYVYQDFDKSKRKPLMEVVDGQQRLTTIRDFVENKIRLGKASSKYCGYIFNDLSDELQKEFLMYSVPVDVLLVVDRPVLLEMFRRINSYTAPLNSAEKRHSEFQGVFKWFINDNADKYSPFLEINKVFTPKQIVRMADAEFLSDLVIVLDQGIVHKSTASLTSLYKKYDKEFPKEMQYQDIIDDFFKTMNSVFEPLCDSYMMKQYALHSLFTAMTHLKYGIPNGQEQLNTATIGKYYKNIACAVSGLLEMAEAHELQDTNGKYSDYVKACLSTTTKISQRKVRTSALIKALMCE